MVISNCYPNENLFFSKQIVPNQLLLLCHSMKKFEYINVSPVHTGLRDGMALTNVKLMIGRRKFKSQAVKRIKKPAKNGLLFSREFISLVSKIETQTRDKNRDKFFRASKR